MKTVKATLPSSQSSRTDRRPHVRWALRRDMPFLLEAEQTVVGPWSEEDICEYLRLHIGLAVELSLTATAGEPIDPVGYVLYRLGEGDHQNVLYLDRLVVNESYRRRGCGSALVDKLIRKLGGRRDTLQTVARESDLGTLAFLQGMGFVAQTPVQRGYFEDTGEDGYVLVYQLGH